MKKIFLTSVLSLFTILASAQFMVTSMVSSPADGEEISLDNLTDNIGVMYSMDKISAGIMMNGDDYNLVARYAFGYALNVWDNLYIEPSYLLDMESEDSEGELKLSLTYKF